ncbi:50S ribosomal protein L3 [Ostertagia ostertagi]
MLRVAVSPLLSTAVDTSRLLITVIPSAVILQSRGRRRTLTPAPWLPPVHERVHADYLDDSNRLGVTARGYICREEMRGHSAATKSQEGEARIADIELPTRRVGLLARKIGMAPQWTVTGDRILCTLLEICENHVVSVVSPDEWYRRSPVGKRKAFNREGPMWKVTVGAVDYDMDRFTQAYRNQFIRAGVPVKKYLGSFLVSKEALPSVGTKLDVRHFCIGQYVTASGKSIDWGFQGGMHRWGMKGQPASNTTKSHRRIGSVGSTGDARVWPGKRMPGHMGYEWVTVSGLEISKVIYVKGSVPGDIDSMLLLKDCLQPDKKLKTGPVPTWLPSIEAAEVEGEEQNAAPQSHEILSPKMFSFSSPSIIFSEDDAKKSAARDKTKAKIAKGGMHRWGMKGQPARNTTKSHRRIGSVGSTGDARVWPGKRMPGHMGYEWVTVSGLENKQVIRFMSKGSVPGDIDSMLLLKDCLQPDKKLKSISYAFGVCTCAIIRILGVVEFHTMLTENVIGQNVNQNGASTSKTPRRAPAASVDILRNNYVRANGFTVHRQPVAQSTDGIRGKIGVSQGVHAFDITWEGPLGTVAVVGVATRHAALHCPGYLPLLGSDDQSWGWNLVDNTLIHNGEQLGVYPRSNNPPKYQVGERVRLVLDCDRHFVYFERAGAEFLGLAFMDLPPVKLFPAICAVYGNTEVSMVYLGPPIAG